MDKDPVFLLDLRIERNGDEVTGLTVTAQSQGEAEFFCSTFPMALRDKSAEIGISEGGIRFWNELCPFQPADVFFSANDNGPLRFSDIERLLAYADANGRFVVHDLRPERIGFRVQHTE